MSILNIFGENSPEQNLKSENKSLSLPGRKLQGVVVSNKMKKTIVVSISHDKKHPKYQKYFTVTKRFKVHDENNQYQVGDKVIIQETKPLSKEKRWKVINKI